MKLKGVIAGLAMAILAGCSGQAASQGAEAPQTSSAAISSALPTAAAWSDEAVKACRTFVNSVPNLSAAQTPDFQYSPAMTDQQLGVAVTGWGMATAGMTLQAGLGKSAEPEVYQAMSAVAAALDVSPADTKAILNGEPASAQQTVYVQGLTDSFAEAIDVCTDVGVIK